MAFMLTTKEAADILGVSPQRVIQLIGNGKLSAIRRGNQWFIDEGSVETRLRTVSKTGGRPRRGHGSHEIRFILMNRQYPVAKVVYDEKHKTFSAITEIIDAARAPIGVFGANRRVSLDAFNNWWRNRGIPSTRSKLQELLAEAEAEVPDELIMRNLGLSLSDQYWVAPETAGLRWEDINFFHHQFDTTAQRIAGYNPLSPATTHAHPDNTSDGNLQKHWVIENRTRLLLKEGGKLNQEPYNEVVATALCRRLLQPGEYVTYKLRGTGGDAMSECQCFVSDTEEYIPAHYVEKLLPIRNDESYYQHYIACCHALSVPGIEASLWKMMVCDDIIANTDRHFRNFGLVRNVETLACRPAPVFDSGTSLWCNTPLSQLKNGEFSFVSKQFEESPARQMLLVEDMSWFDSTDLDGFVEEAMDILSTNRLLEERLPYIQSALQRRVDRMRDIRDWM